MRRTAQGIVALALASAVIGAHAIEMFRAEEVKPYQPPQSQYRQDAPRVDAVQPGPAARNAGISGLMGLWQTNVPGAVYTTPSSIPGYDRLHVSPGGPKGMLNIKSDGTYWWNSYGGKQGRWVDTGNADFPIQLIDTVENKKWAVGFDPKRLAGREIVVWDGSIWYDGRR
jgi:hypothetical protein